MSSLSDHRSAHIRQRWVELENVGSVTIPAFGVCEITGSYRPDTGGTVTPGGGRTVMRVRRAETDDPCAVIVNGSCPIPAGENGRPGTKDDPLLALVDSNYDAGTALGVEKESFILTKRACARYVVDGDYDAATTTQRVDRYDDCPNEMLVRSISCVAIGESHTAQPQKWDDTASDYVDDTDRDPVTVIDPLCWRVALVGDKYKVERENCSQHSYRPSVPFGLTRRVKIKASIVCGAYGPATLMQNDSSTVVGCTWAEVVPACVVNVCNASNRKIACDADEEATAVWIPGECVAFLIPNARSLTATATLTGNMCGTAAGISGISFEDVCEWTPRVAPTSAENPASLYGCTGDTVLLRWNESSTRCDWDVVQVQPHEQSDPVLDIKCETGCTVEKQVPGAKSYAQMCDCTTGPQWESSSLTGQEVNIEYLTVDCSGGLTNCELTKVIQPICVFCALPSQTTGTPLSLIEINNPTGMSVTKYGAGTGGESCEFKIPTAKVCVLGCDMGETGADLSLDLTRVDPVTDVAFGTSVDEFGTGGAGTGGDPPAAICLTPSTTSMYVIACVNTEVEGTPQCIDLSVC